VRYIRYMGCGNKGDQVKRAKIEIKKYEEILTLSQKETEQIRAYFNCRMAEDKMRTNPYDLKAIEKRVEQANKRFGRF